MSNKIKTTIEESNQSAEDGFTLLEMVIAATIFLVVMSTIFGLLRAGNQMKDTVNERSEIATNARTVVDIIGRDIVNAGLGYSRTGAVVPDDFASDLIGVPADGNTDRELFPSIVVGNNVSSSDLSVGGEKNDKILLVYRDLNFNDGNSVEFNRYQRYYNTLRLYFSDGSCDACKNWDVYLIESPAGKQALAMVTTKYTRQVAIRIWDPLDLNRKITGSTTERSILTRCGVGETEHCFDYDPRVTAKRVFLVGYSVNQEGTLVQTTYGNNSGGTAAEQIQTKELAYGVESLQFRYLLTDGTIVDDPTSGNSNPIQANEIVEVEVSVRIKAKNTLNGKVSYERINLQSMFSTRNLRYAYD